MAEVVGYLAPGGPLRVIVAGIPLPWRQLDHVRVPYAPYGFCG